MLGMALIKRSNNVYFYQNVPTCFFETANISVTSVKYLIVIIQLHDGITLSVGVLTTLCDYKYRSQILLSPIHGIRHYIPRGIKSPVWTSYVNFQTFPNCLLDWVDHFPISGISLRYFVLNGYTR